MNDFPSENELEAMRLLMNSKPIDDFEGFTPMEMHQLVYSTLGNDSPLKINLPLKDETLDQIPFLRITEEFLKIVRREGKIKLTPLGALPKKIVTELYNHRLIVEDAVEKGYRNLSRESDSNALVMLHYNTAFAGLVKKAYGRIQLTKAGEKFLTPENRNNLFLKILDTYTEKLPWSSLDLYPEVPVGNLGWGFTVILLLKYGEQIRDEKFYAEKYIRGFPSFLQQFPPGVYNTALEDLTRCYCLRSFERFLEWWGFTKSTEVKSWSVKEPKMISRTPILAEVFQATF